MSVFLYLREFELVILYFVRGTLNINLRRILGLVGILIGLYTILFTQIKVEVIIVSENVAAFYKGVIHLAFVYYLAQILWNMVTGKINKKNLFDRLFVITFIILVAYTVVNYQSLIANGAVNFNIPWILTFVLVPLIGLYDMKRFGFTDERLDESAPAK